MIKVKDGYAKLIGTTYAGSADRVLLSNGGDKAISDFAAASEVVTALGTNGNYVTWTKNGAINNLTVPYATRATYLKITPGLTTETDITESELRVYRGSGSGWTGEVTSMAYAGILALGDPSRGFQMWARRGTGNIGSLHFRVGNNDGNAWESVRTILDSANWTSYISIPTVTNYYWANISISETSSESTTPTFNTVYSSSYINVGKGLSKPEADRAQLAIISDTGKPCDIILGADKAKYWGITARNSESNNVMSKAFGIYDYNAAYYRLTIDQNGNMYVGQIISNKTQYHNITALGFYESSDMRLKTFLSDIKIDFEKLRQLPKMYFTWKSDEKDMPDLHIGTSAQEVQKLFPELVNDVNGYLTVAYDKLSIIALKAVDDLYEMIVELKKQNSKLKSKIDKLERRVYYGKKY